MKPSTFLICAALFVTAAGAQALDLTPNFTNTLDDLMGPRHPFFYDGARRYGVTIDRETEVTAEGGAVFRFTTLEGASFHIRFSPNSPQLPFKGDDLKTYRSAAMGLIPSGSTEAAIVAETKDSLAVNEWKSYQFILSYKLPGRELRMQVTFLNLDDKQQLLLQTESDASHFAAAQTRSTHIMNSWHEITADELKQGRGN